MKKLLLFVRRLGPSGGRDQPGSRPQLGGLIDAGSRNENLVIWDRNAELL